MPETGGCTTPLPDDVIDVLGTPGSTFTVTVAAATSADSAGGQATTAVDWLSATVTQTMPSVPSQILLSFDEDELKQPGVYAANVVIDAIVADQDQSSLTLRVPVSVICTNEVLYLPSVRR